MDSSNSTRLSTPLTHKGPDTTEVKDSPYFSDFTALLPLKRSTDGHLATNLGYGSIPYLALCGLGGGLSIGLTHGLIDPLIQRSMKMDHAKFPSMWSALRATVSAESARGLVKSWVTTTGLYHTQGCITLACCELLVSSHQQKREHRGYCLQIVLGFVLFRHAFANEERIMSTTTPVNRNPVLSGFYKGQRDVRVAGLTMIQFLCYEEAAYALYQGAMPKPQADCSKSEQLAVSLAAGYIAGIVCALGTHTAEVRWAKEIAGPRPLIEAVAKQIAAHGRWSGLVPRAATMGALAALQWTIYEGFKMVMGIPRPEFGAVNESLRKKMEVLPSPLP